MDGLGQLERGPDNDRTALPVRTGLQAGSLEVNCIVEAFDTCMALHDDRPLCSYAAMENCYLSIPS